VPLEDYLYLAANLSLFTGVLLAWAGRIRPRVARIRLTNILLALFLGTQAVALCYSVATRGPGTISYPWSIATIAVGAAALGLLVIDRSPRGTSAHATALTAAFAVHSCALLRMYAPEAVPPNTWTFLNIWFVLHLLSAAAALGAYLLAAGDSITWVVTAVSTRVKPAQEWQYPGAVTGLCQRALRIAFPLLTMSIIARSLWSYLGWGTYWSWRAEGAGLLALWLLLTSALHVPLPSRWHQPARVLLVLVGLLVGLVTVPALGEGLTGGV